MTIEENLNYLKKSLVLNGWIPQNEDDKFSYYYNAMDIKFSIPKLKEDSEYPIMLFLLLKKIERQIPTIVRSHYFRALKSQCKNLKQSYSKDKSEWILQEPNCKYHYSEIPEIYIPILYL